MTIAKTGTVGALMVALALLAGPLLKEAVAGPTIEFGDEGQGLLRIDYKAQFQFISRDTGSGPDNTDRTSTANFRRNRLAFIGAWGDMLGIYVQTDFVEDLNVGNLSVGSDFGSHFTLLDAQLRFKFNDMFRVRVGKFKANLTRENLEDCYQPLTLDRSVFLKEPFVLSTRDRGLAVWGNLLDNRLQYKLDVLEGRPADSESPDSSFRYGGRLHLSLLDPESGYGYRGTYRGDKQVLTIGAGYQFEPDMVYANAAAETGASDYKAWTADVFFEYPLEEIGTVTLSSAYMDVDIDEAYKGADPEAQAIGQFGERNGYYVKGGYMLPNLPLQFFGRYEGWSFANLSGIPNQDLGWLGLGVNYYVRGQNLKLTFEYQEVDFDKEATACQDFKTVVAQLQVIF